MKTYIRNIHTGDIGTVRESSTARDHLNDCGGETIHVVENVTGVVAVLTPYLLKTHWEEVVCIFEVA